METETGEREELGTCKVCYHAKALLSQAMYDSSIMSFNCGHGVTEILEDSDSDGNHGETEVVNDHSPIILKPMSLKTITQKLHRNANAREEKNIECLLCQEMYPTVKNGEKSPVLAHLLTQHKLVIADVDKIADFNKYMSYWKKRFSSMDDITQYCVVINSNTGSEDIDPSEKYFLLTDFLPEDELLRNKLNTEKLSYILEEHQAERNNYEFSRSCLFCKSEFCGNRAELFKHMSVEHSFNVGNPDNIVHAAEFIDFVKTKLDDFVCIFCEKQFSDSNILSEHMKKKGHKRIDPKNKEYDKYYLINYLDPGKNWKELQSEPDYEKELITDENSCFEKEWEDWVETEEMVSLCLFCTKTDEDVNKILSHMKNDHDFDIQKIKAELELNFYDQIKIINYIRKQVHLNKCPSCLEDLETRDNLNEHVFTERHYGLVSDRSVWDQAIYLFPTFDDDSLLCFLEDDPEEDENQNITS